MRKTKQKKIRKTKQKKIRGLGSIKPTDSEDLHTETEIEQMTKVHEKYIKDELGKISLGHPDYVPTKSEAICIVDNGRKGAIELKKSLFYVWKYKLYKYDPYNCTNLAEFAVKYFGISKATVYRQLNQVIINHSIHGEFGGENYICDFHCQKVKRYLKIIEKEGESLKSFWEFLSCSEPGGITAELIEKYALLLGYSGSLITLEEGKKMGLPLYKFVDTTMSKSLKKYENELIEEKAVPPNKNYDEGNEDYDEGNEDYDEGNEDYDEGNEDYDEGNEDYDEGNEDYDEGNEDYDEGNEDYDEGNEDYETVYET